MIHENEEKQTNELNAQEIKLRKKETIWETSCNGLAHVVPTSLSTATPYEFFRFIFFFG